MELALVENHVVLARFEHVGGELPRFVHHLGAGAMDCDASDREAATAVRSVAHGRALRRVAVMQLHALDRNAQVVGDDLAERRFVPLAMGMGAGIRDH